MLMSFAMGKLRDRLESTAGGKEAYSKEGANGLPSGAREVSEADLDPRPVGESGPPVNIQKVTVQTGGMEAPENEDYAERLGMWGGDSVHLVPLQSDDDADTIARNSWVLAGIISAKLDNVYGSRPVARPIADPVTSEGRQVIRSWIRMQRSRTGRTEGTWTKISDAAVDKAADMLEARVELETALVDGFFSTCDVDMCYEDMAALSGYDYEVRGRTYIEVLRDMKGRPSGLQWSPARYIKAEVPSPAIGFNDVRVYNPLVVAEEYRWRRFYGCFQTTRSDSASAAAYFKDFGDPRIRSRSDGLYYGSLQDLVRAEAEREIYGGRSSNRRWAPGTPATEIKRIVKAEPWAAITGMAPWYSAKTELLGIRELSQENRGLLSGQLVPLLMWLVHGGARITPDQVELWQKELEAAVQPGSRSVVIMQVLSDAMAKAGRSGAGEPKSSVVNTRPAQQDDALGMKYTEQSERGARRP